MDIKQWIPEIKKIQPAKAEPDVFFMKCDESVLL